MPKFDDADVQGTLTTAKLGNLDQMLVPQGFVGLGATQFSPIISIRSSKATVLGTSGTNSTTGFTFSGGGKFVVLRAFARLENYNIPSGSLTFGMDGSAGQSLVTVSVNGPASGTDTLFGGAEGDQGPKLVDAGTGEWKPSVINLDAGGDVTATTNLTLTTFVVRSTTGMSGQASIILMGFFIA